MTTNAPATLDPAKAAPNVPTGASAARDDGEDDQSDEPIDLVRLYGSVPDAIYRARVSETDRLNSRSEPLDDPASILRQERAWFHRYGRRDADDTADPIFVGRDARDWFSDAARPLRPDVARAIMQGTPLVEVYVWTRPRRIEVRLISR